MPTFATFYVRIYIAISYALFYNICMIPLATGLLPISLNPMVASLAMTISSLTVVLNALRLSRMCFSIL